MQALEDRALHRPSTEDEIEQAARRNAAVRIQRAWRKHMRKKYLSPSFLWFDAAVHARMKVRHSANTPVILPPVASITHQVDRDAAEQGKNTARDRWKRGASLASRLKDGNNMLTRTNTLDTHNEATRKHLETQHWLELIDG